MHQIKRRFLILLMLALLASCFFLCSSHAEGAEISGMVWVDKDVNGLNDNEKPLGDVKVSLQMQQEDGSFALVSSVKTDKNGLYSLNIANPGYYRLSFELPNGYLFTFHGKDSSVLPAQGGKSTTPVFTVADGDALTVNAGATRTTSYVAAVAFEDENANGGRMSSENAIRSLPVTLLYEYDGTIYEIASAKTDKKGECAIRDLSPAVYTLRAQIPEYYVTGPLGEKINTYHNCLLPSDDLFAYTAPFTLEAKSSVGLGLGLVKTGTIQGKIWYDANSNGQWDEDEKGLTQASINLLSGTLSTDRTVSPDEDGSYAFTRLQPGIYLLNVQLPENMLFTDGAESLLNTIASSDQLKVSVETDRTSRVSAIGGAPAASVTLQLCEDENGNSVSDETESFLADVTAVLFQNGKEIAKAVSDESGMVCFPVAREGEAQILCELPEGYLFTDDGIRGDDLYEGVITVQSAEDGPTSLALHAVLSGSISGFVFDDPDNLGIYQDTCGALSGFLVQAADENGEIAGEAETDENGNYVLEHLLPGTYTVRFQLGDSYIASPYTEGSEISNHIASQTPEYGETGAFSLKAGENVTHMDGAVFKAGIIDGYVVSGAPEANANGLNGVTVTLLDAEYSPYADYAYDVTDANGYFVIKGVLPGSYALQYELPVDMAFLDTDDESIDTELFSITGGAQLHMPEIAAVRTGEISGNVNRMIPDASLPAPALIQLTAASRNEVLETETLEDGSFCLSHLRPDDYNLRVTLPDGLVFAAVPDSILDASMDASAAYEFTLKEGEIIDSVTVTADVPAMLSGCAYFDGDMDLLHSPEEAVSAGRELVLSLNGEEISRLMTDENGRFLSDDLIPGHYTLSVVLAGNEIIVDDETWDVNASCTVSVYNGCDEIGIPLLAYASLSGSVWNLDGSENQVSGLQIALYDRDGGIVQTTVTDSKGAWKLSSLLPGEYSLKSDLPEGYLFAREQDAQSRASFIQSNASGKTVFLPLPVEMGVSYQQIDIGMGAMGSIGDHAWLDENKNGMQDIGEPDMPGILIEMYQHGELTASATTDEFGRYSFRDLYPGVYEMRVTMHKELKPTVQQFEFPLVASVLPESDDTTVTALVTVPSGGENLHCDLGFVLRQKGVYPKAMEDTPSKDWTPYADR